MPDKDKRKESEDGRKARLAAELRANLARRKAQARARRDGSDGGRNDMQTDEKD